MCDLSFLHPLEDVKDATLTSCIVERPLACSAAHLSQEHAVAHPRSCIHCATLKGVFIWQAHFSPRGAAPLQSSLQSVDPHVAAAAAAAAARYNPQMQQQQVDKAALLQSPLDIIL